MGDMITYLVGDATRPDPMSEQQGGPQLIVHICNNVGGWGRGFVMALSKRWPEPERAYRSWHKKGDNGLGLDQELVRFELGQIQMVKVIPRIDRPKDYSKSEFAPPDVIVVNMIAQEGYGARNDQLHRSDEADGKPPIRYDALDACLAKVAEWVESPASIIGCGTVHMPRIGCGLAGGRWEEVEPLIQKNLPTTPVYVYDL